MTNTQRKPARVDAATNYAIGKLRELGRELASGSWSRGAAPTTVHQAVAVIASALSHVVDTGTGSLVETFRETYSPRQRQPLNFDTEAPRDRSPMPRSRGIRGLRSTKR